MKNSFILLFIAALWFCQICVKAQDSWGAWSNPVFPRVETGEVSSASKIERLNFSLNVLRSPDSRGGHFEYRGLGPKREVIEHIHPQHRHEVSLNFTRIELGIRYFMRNTLALSLDLPYDIKKQKAWVDFLGHNQTPENRDAILANRDIHHRTETYTGLSDFEFSVNLLITIQATSFVWERNWFFL